MRKFKDLCISWLDGRPLLPALLLVVLLYVVPICGVIVSQLYFEGLLATIITGGAAIVFIIGVVLTYIYISATKEMHAAWPENIDITSKPNYNYYRKTG